ncbi:LptF/LptG family permease [Fusobacterium nucleatum]|uniref:LptF/LptG family permease n=1 Tax=Fusobacterium nucleatum TaxID=851 RepID=UPI003D0091E7
MIKKMDIYISKYFIKFFLMNIIAFIGIFLLAQTFKIIKYINQGKLEGAEILDYILNLLPKMFVETAPLSVLLAGLITISIMASNLEIVSLKTSGIRFFRIIRAPLIIAFMISLFVFFINNSIYTKSLAKINFYRKGEVDNSLKLPTTKENAFFINSTEGYLYLMGKINRETGVAENIEIIKFDMEISKPKEIIIAKSAKFDTKENKWLFNNVNIYNVNTKETVTKTEYKSELYKDDPSNFIRASAEDPRMLTIKELKKTIKEQKNIGEDTRVYLAELAKRYSFPFASFIVAFIGLSVSSKYIRGGRTTMNLVICVVAGYGYYLVSGAFEAMSLNGILNPFIASWIPNILYLIVGLYFMNRAEY